MKLLALLLLTLPIAAQPPCDPPRIMSAIKQFKPAYKKAEVKCSGGNAVLILEAKHVSGDLLANAVEKKLRPLVAEWGMNRLVIEAYYWDKTVTGEVYSVTPATVITTRTGSTSVSTVTGGNVASRHRYTYKRLVATAIIEP